mmetsp:Transcript_133768/g.286076  ORF Transcript_133768/g.286076 Transcript_133768/m.286076 type:complete len:517 (+) Transcript_133768:51-1601(+)
MRGPRAGTIAAVTRQTAQCRPPQNCRVPRRPATGNTNNTGLAAVLRLDRWDSIGEWQLGLCMTAASTVAVWVLLLPLFHFEVFTWLRSWEPKPPVRAPITLEKFMKALQAVYETPGDSFAAMDLNHDDVLRPEEFIEGVKTFKPPLNRTQAEYAFRGLDMDPTDGVLSEVEFENAWVMQYFFQNATTTSSTITTITTSAPPTTTTSNTTRTTTTSTGTLTTSTTTATTFTSTSSTETTTTITPLSLSEYIRRREQAPHLAVVVLRIPGLNFRLLSKAQREDLHRSLLGAFVSAIGVPEENMLDVSNDPGRLTLSIDKDGSPGLRVKTKIVVPEGSSARDLVTFDTRLRLKSQIATALSQVKTIRHAITGGIDESSLDIAIRRNHAVAFIAMDQNHNGLLSSDEYVIGTKNFKPPLTEDEARYAFDGLDHNNDDRLSALEYEGYGIKHFFEKSKSISPAVKAGKYAEHAKEHAKHLAGRRSPKAPGTSPSASPSTSPSTSPRANDGSDQEWPVISDH